ncbi:unnamed protein product [Callosobruchus maculatus]|uniref:Uncharacterized protein n=1 Tax=Callosobruchus maculatus TaxID=64391 RepID=A0A653CQA6_CALMS|nr:unnamed protein product [Callosobruchus maculatus]
MTTFRPVISVSDFYTPNQLDSPLLTKSRHKNRCIPGRFSYCTLRSGDSKNPSTSSGSGPRIFRLDNSKNPQSEIEFLDIVWNPTLNAKRIALHKKHSILVKLRSLRKRKRWSWQQAKSLLGSLNFAAFFIAGKCNARALGCQKNFRLQDSPFLSEP